MATSGLQAPKPVYTASLFWPLHQKLLAVLRSLADADWGRPAAGSWRVRDLVAHLLHGDLRQLSLSRGSAPTPVVEKSPGYEEVVELIDRDNEAGVRFLSQFGPMVLTDLLEVTGASVAKLFGTLDPHQVARTSVLWAGDERPEAWMDMGRELTERWHHQMQIRDAVEAPLLLEQLWIEPILDLSVRALPRSFGARLPECPVGTSVELGVAGESPLEWTVKKDAAGWRLWVGADSEPDASLEMSADTAWRLFYGLLASHDALARVEIVGDVRLVEPILEARSVMI